MKFYGQPNSLVREMRRKPFSTEYEFKPVFRFDEKGEYSTSDDRLIQKLKRKFKYEEEKKFTCKKCGEEFENRGLMLAHYRANHPKED
jgi:hypothetical protein